MAPFFGKSIQHITAADIHDLRLNDVRESTHLEYKLELPDNSDGAKKEFVQDVAAFANAGGGWLIYGIEEEKQSNKSTGKIKSIPGVSTATPDDDVLRLETMCRMGVDPRILGLSFRAISVGTDLYVFVGSVPLNADGPYMVTVKSSNKYWSRGSNGKFLMSSYEIKASAIASSSLLERIVDWRNKAYERRGIPSTGIVPPPMVMLHIIPIASALPGEPLALESVEKNARYFLPLHGFMRNKRSFRYLTNSFFQGYEWATDVEKTKSPYAAYVQVFNRGQIEACDSRGFEEGTIKPIPLERDILETTKLYFRGLRELGLEPPFLVSVAILNGKGLMLKVDESDQRRFQTEGAQLGLASYIEILPELVLRSWEELDGLGAFYRPLFNSLWNAFGWPYCPHFDAVSGKWTNPMN